MIDQPDSHIGVLSLFNEVASTSDFQTYLSNFRPDLEGFTFNLLSVDGGINPQTVAPSESTNAYTQVIAGLASKVPMTFIAVGTKTSDGPVSTSLK